MNVTDILNKLGNKNEKTDHMVWVGKDYSIRDLKRDLQEIVDNHNEDEFLKSICEGE